MTAPVSDRHSADTVYRRRWAILGVLSLSVFLAVVDNTIVNVALPRMSEELKASTSQLQWIVDAYSLVFAGLLLVGGSLGDRYGRKGALQFGVGAFAGFSLFAALSGSTHVLIAARALMGLAAAFIFPATLAILTNTFTDAKERAAAIGVWTGVVGLAVALGPLSGGALLQHFWWGSIFFVNLPVAAVAMALGAWLIPKTKDPAAPRLDLLGFVLSIVGIVAVVYTTIEAPGRGWTNPATVVGYVGGAAVLALFALWERRTSQPMLDVDLFRNIRFSAASFSITVSFFALFGYIFLITQYFQLVRGYDTLSAGVHTLPFAIGTGMVAPAAPALAARVGTKIIVPLGLVLMGGGFLVSASLGVDTPFFGPVLVSMLLIAVGLGMVAAPSTDAILAVLPPAKAGVGSAVNDVTRELGGAFGVAVVGAVFSSVYGPHLIGRLAGIGLPAPALAAARESTAAALGVAGQAPPQVRQAIVDAARSSFVDGFSRGSLVCSGVVVAGAIFAFLVLPTRLPAVATPPVNPTPAVA
ncbi:MAG: DHA2 family efflux MFS transporter permease subunit [Actinomycetota bacterium]|nr:DHA2 family efflux MFS transporter permease subunit [Actinomycetota bacterium]